jgi:hypothetical protein
LYKVAIIDNRNDTFDIAMSAADINPAANMVAVFIPPIQTGLNRLAVGVTPGDLVICPIHGQLHSVRMRGAEGQNQAQD